MAPSALKTRKICSKSRQIQRKKINNSTKMLLYAFWAPDGSTVEVFPIFFSVWTSQLPKKSSFVLFESRHWARDFLKIILAVFINFYAL